MDLPFPFEICMNQLQLNKENCPSENGECLCQCFYLHQKKFGFECLFVMIWNRVYLSLYRMLARICLVIQGIVDNLNSRLESFLRGT